MTSDTRRLATAALVISTIAIAAFYVRARSSPPEPDSWPAATVRLITPNAAGGGPDFAIRLMAAALRDRWQQPVIVDNRPGAEGVLAVRAMVDASNDHTLLVAPTSVITTNPLIRDSLPYTSDDLAPVTALVQVPIAVAVSCAFQARTIEELVALAKARPRGLSYTTVFGAPQVLWRAFEQQAGFEMGLVGYRNPNEALPDLLGGRVHVALLPLGTVIPQARAGKLHLLAVLDGRRSAAAPHVPTLAEAGYPQLRLGGALGLFSGRRMAAQRRDWLHREVKDVLESAPVRQRLLDAGFEVGTSSPAAFARTLGEHRASLRRMVQLAGQPR